MSYLNDFKRMTGQLSMPGLTESAGTKPTAKALQKEFGLEPAKATELADLFDRAHNNMTADRAMSAANTALDAHGVEAIRGVDADDNFWQDIIAIYVNMGDSYAATVLYDVKTKKFSITSYGDYVEKQGDKVK